MTVWFCLFTLQDLFGPLMLQHTVKETSEALGSIDQCSKHAFDMDIVEAKFCLQADGDLRIRASAASPSKPPTYTLSSFCIEAGVMLTAAS